MNSEQRENLNRLVSELDLAVPCEAAAVKMVVYGGAPDESRMVGNEVGYLRLGIELLKGTLEATQDEGTDTRSLDIDLDYLTTNDSTIYFSGFTIDDKLRTEFVSPDLSRWQRLRDKLSIIGLCAFGIFLLVALITGMGTVVVWLVGLLKHA